MLIHIHLIIVPLLLLISAIFAAAEAALFSLSRTQLEAMRTTKPSLFRKISQLIAKPDVFLSTIIVGNECLNILIGTFVAGLLEIHFKEVGDKWLMVIAVLISSALMLTFSEILPKVLAFRLPVLFSSVLVYPMSWAQLALTPIRKIFMGLSGKLLAIFGLQASAPAGVSEKDFLTLVEVGAESGSLRRDEKEMITNVFHFSDIPVASVMTPWSKVFHLSTTDLALDKVISAVKNQGYSRIPVLASDENRVAGILYMKELLKLMLEGNASADTSLKNAIFPPYIVSSHKKVSKLFREFKLKKVHIALVVDEYGRHLGVVTLEDLLNALFRTQKRSEESA